MAKQKSTAITARVLIAVSIAGIAFQPNQLVKAETELLKNHIDNGELSDNEADVDYCVSIGEEVHDIDEEIKLNESKKLDPEKEE